MTWKIELTPAAQRDLEGLRRSRDLLIRIDRAIERLRDDPYPAGSRNLVATDGLRRVRIGDYRVIYEVTKSSESTPKIDGTVVILRVRHRSDVYR